MKPKVVHDQVAINLKYKEVRGVIALIDVVTSGVPQQFKDAQAAIDYLLSCHPADPRYRAHAAQYEFEAWLLPFWDDIVV